MLRISKDGYRVWYEKFSKLISPWNPSLVEQLWGLMFDGTHILGTAVQIHIFVLEKTEDDIEGKKWQTQQMFYKW